MVNAVAENKSGIRWIKILGIITLIGVVAAVGRIVLRVFREESHRTNEGAANSDSQSGV